VLQRQFCFDAFGGKLLMVRVMCKVREKVVLEPVGESNLKNGREEKGNISSIGGPPLLAD